MWFPIGDIAFFRDKIDLPMFDEFKKDDGIYAGVFFLLYSDHNNTIICTNFIWKI